MVKAEAALRLREAGVRKPVLLMGLFGDDDGAELVRNGVHLALTTDDAADRVARAQRAAGRSARTHAYLDTGMSRMGIPYHRALSWLEDLSKRGVVLDGTFMAFTEESDFDPEQLRRFLELAAAARSRGIELGALHAASSNGVYHLPDAHLDMVRPGIALFGAYPSYPERERALGELRPAVRLRARVVRVERLRPGDSVSYGREYVAREPTWIATIPAGHTDGVPREAVKGQQILIGQRLYPAIGAVSASHTIVEVGPEQTVRVGDVGHAGGARPPRDPSQRGGGGHGPLRLRHPHAPEPRTSEARRPIACRERSMRLEPLARRATVVVTLLASAILPTTLAAQGPGRRPSGPAAPARSSAPLRVPRPRERGPVRGDRRRPG